MSRSLIAPLQGKRILVTRTREQASVFSEKLRSLGATPIEFPTIRIVPPQDWSALDAALHRLYNSDSTDEQPYDWLVLTSVNGVHICMERLLELGYEPGTLQNVRVATIGPATAAALADYGISAALIPEAYIAESVAVALLEDAQQHGSSLVGRRILLARAAEARRVLVTELQHAGALVDEVAAYFTVPVASDDGQGRAIMKLLKERQLDLLTFTSSSTVRNFMAWLKSYGDEADGLLTALTIACIGPVTSQTARELDLHVEIEAQEFTIDGLITAILNYEETNDRTDDDNSSR